MDMRFDNLLRAELPEEIEAVVGVGVGAVYGDTANVCVEYPPV